jgi:glycosyltransferase involved in cell wall biosynthesis
MKVLMLLRSAIDNDSRVKKEINTLKSNGHKITLLSVNSAEYNDTKHFSLTYHVKRRLIPGLSLLYVFFTFLKFAFNNYSNHKIIHAHDLNTLAVAVLLKLRHKKDNIKIIYDAHEYETERHSNKNQLSKYIDCFNERLCIKYVDKVITVSASIGKEYQRLYKIEPPSLVLNCPNYQKVSRDNNLFREKLSIHKEATIFLYQGGLGRGRGIELLLEAFAKNTNENQVIVFMGYGPLESMVNDYCNQHCNIYFHEAVSQKVLLSYTSSADVGILFYEDNCLNHRYCSPNKMFEYLMAGLPVIVSNLVEMKKITEQYEIGVVAKDNTLVGFSDAILEIEQMDRRKLLTSVLDVQNLFSWEQQEGVLLKVYNEL